MPSTLDRDVLVVLGDTPLLTPQTLQEFHAHYIQQKADLSVLAVRPPNPLGYGRLITSDSQVEKIVEEKEADEITKAIILCNGGAMILGPQAQTMLSQIDSANKAGEYYLTDLVYLLKIKGLSVTFFEAPFEEALGINTRADLAKAEAILQGRLRQKALDQGVTLMDPESTYLSFDTSFSEDVTLFPHVFLGPGVTLGRDSTVFAFSVLENTLLKPGARVGPFCHLRHGTTVGEGAVIGNFVEVKQSVIGTGTSAKHLSYIGNATIGAHANIGAGAITCNYDGQSKHETVIGDKAFIGSNSSLIAPVTIGDHALIAAGSVITKNVPENTLAVGRARQTHLPRKRPQAP
jgi:bifunctional UDP-N-acetylglucosamine pyrophosphorylase/glucosamine-1-phosphate N-acetyltransferase